MADANGHADASSGNGGDKGSGSTVVPADEEQPVEAGALSVEPEKPEFGIPEGMTYWKLFKIFLRFGCLAVGGPVRLRGRLQGCA